jgi:protein ImuB
MGIFRIPNIRPMVVSSVDAAARKSGLHIGMPAAKAQALFRGLMMVDAEPHLDAAALERITLWALTKYSPIVAVDGLNGIVLDTEGADHLQGGELPMATKIANQFLAKRLAARVAIADTWGAAHACARVINRETVIVPKAKTAAAVERLPITLLWLPEKVVADPRDKLKPIVQPRDMFVRLCRTRHNGTYPEPDTMPSPFPKARDFR